MNELPLASARLKSHSTGSGLRNHFTADSTLDGTVPHGGVSAQSTPELQVVYILRKQHPFSPNHISGSDAITPESRGESAGTHTRDRYPSPQTLPLCKRRLPANSLHLEPRNMNAHRRDC